MNPSLEQGTSATATDDPFPSLSPVSPVPVEFLPDNDSVYITLSP